MKIIGAGLDSRQKQIIIQFIRDRRALSLEERESTGFSQDLRVEANRSKLFAAWLAGCQIALDRPIFFLAGAIALAFTLAGVIVTIVQ
jgi:hypothetical protein